MALENLGLSEQLYLERKEQQTKHPEKMNAGPSLLELSQDLFMSGKVLGACFGLGFHLENTLQLQMSW